jgi:hypothetical protein
LEQGAKEQGQQKAQQQRRGCRSQAVECRCWARPNFILQKEEVNLLRKYADKIYARFASGKTNRGNRNFQRY